MGFEPDNEILFTNSVLIACLTHSQVRTNKFELFLFIFKFKAGSICRTAALNHAIEILFRSSELTNTCV